MTEDSGKKGGHGAYAPPLLSLQPIFPNAEPSRFPTAAHKTRATSFVPITSIFASLGGLQIGTFRVQSSRKMTAGTESKVVLVTGCSKGGIGFALYASWQM